MSNFLAHLPQKRQLDPTVAGANYLPRIELKTAKAGVVASGFPANHYAFTKGRDNPIDLGAEISVIILDSRPMALDTSVKPPVFSYDSGSTLFNKIRSLSATQDSNCQYGSQWLVWHPERGYATIFLGTKTNRNLAGTFADAQVEPEKDVHYLTLGCRLIEIGKYKYNAMSASKGIIAQETPTDITEMLETIEKFRNPVVAPPPAEAPADDRDR